MSLPHDIRNPAHAAASPRIEFFLPTCVRRRNREPARSTSVLERFGLQGFGAHSNDAEYIALDSIEPRLYLLARLIMDVSQGKDRR